MRRRSRKRSSCDSGSGNVPSYSRGFWVASTMNGRGSGYVEWSSETCASFIASSRADWVLGVVRLISSASTMLVKSGPGLNTNSPVFGSHTETPSTSDGSMSEVNWMRWNEAPIERASAAASVVLPTPGTSSISRWPRATRPMTASRTTSGLPTRARPTLSSRRRMISVEPPIGFHYTVRGFFGRPRALARAGRHRLQCGRDDPRDPALPALAPRRARRVRVHLRSRRGDPVDGARSARAGHALAGPLRSGGGAAPHSRAAAGQRDPRILLHPGVGGRAPPGRGARHRGGRPRDRLPRRRARARERAAGGPGGSDPGQEPRGPDPHRREAAARLPGARVAALPRDARPARPPRLRLLVEHDGPAVALPAPGGGRAPARGDPGLVGARRRALLHVHRAAIDPAAGPGAPGLAHRVRGHHRGARGDQLHLPPPDHRPSLAPGLPARADRPRAPHPAGMDRLARGDQRPLPRDRRGLDADG